ncbi:hypothetical protein ACFQY7_24375 [Actinomadura luteofluorescens]|uniref:hypothetical protein n=1 Tax=Actinomadura luteofluorescens TaxID=46163 RepID=UPI003635EDC3
MGSIVSAVAPPESIFTLIPGWLWLNAPTSFSRDLAALSSWPCHMTSSTVPPESPPPDEEQAAAPSSTAARIGTRFFNGIPPLLWISAIRNTVPGCGKS